MTRAEKLAKLPICPHASTSYEYAKCWVGERECVPCWEQALKERGDRFAEVVDKFIASSWRGPDGTEQKGE